MPAPRILIAGGGPVGLAAAIAARLRGLEATVLEPRRGPIDKACGEGLMPGALPLFAALGVELRGRPLEGVEYRDARGAVQHRFRAGPGLGVRRTVLHAALAARAAAVGVEVLPGRLLSLSQDSAAVTVRSGLGEHRAEYLLAADGLHSTVAGLVGLTAPDARRRRYGLRRHYALSPWSELVEVHFSRLGELYVTPVGDDAVGIALLGRRGLNLDAAIEESPGLRERVRGAAMASDDRGAGAFPTRTRGRRAGRVLLIGDAAGYPDALTGEGIRLGVAEALAAVDAVAAGRPERYEREWRRLGRPVRALTGGLAAWADSTLRGAIVPAARTLPPLFSAIVERLAR